MVLEKGSKTVRESSPRVSIRRQVGASVAQRTSLRINNIQNFNLPWPVTRYCAVELNWRNAGCHTDHADWDEKPLALKCGGRPVWNMVELVLNTDALPYEWLFLRRLSCQSDQVL